MNIFQIAGVGIVGTVLCILLKEHKPEIALLISIVTGIAIFFLVQDHIAYAIQAIQSVLSSSGVNFQFFDVVLKVIGVSYIALFASEMCIDAGQRAIASKIELGAKLVIFALSLPVVLSRVNILLGIIS